MIGEGQPYRAAEIAKVLDLVVVATLPDAPDAAAVLSPGRGTDPAASRPGGYLRALTAAVGSAAGAGGAQSHRPGGGGTAR